MEVPEGDLPGGRTQKLCAPPHVPCPMHLFHLAVHLYSLQHRL
jgi:hypothetical protein